MLRDARTRLTCAARHSTSSASDTGHAKLSDIARAGARRGAGDDVLLAHTPSRLTEAAQLAVPLVLSGHTHGGQMVLPGLGAVAARKFPIVAGHGSLENTSVFVSRGVGTVYVPIRLHCPPEVAILTLRPADVS